MQDKGVEPMGTAGLLGALAALAAVLPGCGEPPRAAAAHLL